MEMYLLETDFFFTVSKRGSFGILSFAFCKVHARKNVLQQIFPSNLFTSLFSLSNAGCLLAPVFSWLLSSPSFIQIK